jgi:hypothetical protein
MVRDPQPVDTPTTPEDTTPPACRADLARVLTEDGILCLLDLEGAVFGMQGLDLPANVALEVVRCQAGVTSLQAAFTALSDALEGQGG